VEEEEGALSGARAAIFGRLEAAQRTARLPPVESAPAPRETPPRTPEECLERFRAELLALGVESHVEASEEAVRARVAGLLAGRRVLSWDPAHLPYGLGAVLVDPVLGGSPRDAQAAAEVGLTGCLAAVAETGSLALVSGPGRARLVSLLPAAYVAVVRRADLCYSMGEFFREHAGSLDASASCTLITGPSRTADIELTLTLGVHGPGKVTVVVGP
jgi:L-lactate dehydrogenase complex protein LldG